MPRLAAAAYPRGWRVVDYDVPAFAAVAVFAIDREIADNDPAAHARTERQEDNAVVLLPAADPRLAVGSGICVVCKCRRQAECLGHAVANREIVPMRQIVRL